MIYQFHTWAVVEGRYSRVFRYGVGAVLGNDVTVAARYLTRRAGGGGIGVRSTVYLFSPRVTQEGALKGTKERISGGVLVWACSAGSSTR